jgi:hypothetical protein
MEASGYESLVGLFRKLVVPFGDGGLFFSCWADFVGEVGSVLWGSNVALPRAAGFLFMLAVGQRTFNHWGERESF